MQRTVSRVAGSESSRTGGSCGVVVGGGAAAIEMVAAAGGKARGETALVLPDDPGALAVEQVAGGGVPGAAGEAPQHVQDGVDQIGDGVAAPILDDVGQVRRATRFLGRGSGEHREDGATAGRVVCAVTGTRLPVL